MNPVIRGIAVYLFVYVVFRIMGKRSLAEITPFDFVLMLIISETTTDALIGEDYSLTACFIMVATLVSLDLLLTFSKQKSKLLQLFTDGSPLIIVANGKPLKKRMDKAQVDEDDILEQARLLHGLERMEDVKYAILERDGSISIIPMKKN